MPSSGPANEPSGAKALLNVRSALIQERTAERQIGAKLDFALPQNKKTEKGPLTQSQLLYKMYYSYHAREACIYT